MSFFSVGGPLYGVVYTIWRGYGKLVRILATGFYRRTLGSCGRRTVFAQGIYVAYPRRVTVGSDCYIGAGVMFVREHGLGTLIIGDNVQIGENCRIDYTGGVVVGDNALLSANVHIYSHDHGYDPRSAPAASKLVIERDAWIGAHAIVLTSTQRIGRGAVVGAGSVVTRTVPDGAIVAGNPAQFVKMREI